MAFGLEVDGGRIRAGRRRPIESTCRAIVAWLACTELGVSAAEVGRLTGVTGGALGVAKARGEVLAETYGLRRVEDLPTPIPRPASEVQPRPGLDTLLLAAAMVSGLTPAELRDPHRGRQASAGRRLFSWLAVRDFGYRPSEVGSYVGRHPSIAAKHSKAEVIQDAQAPGRDDFGQRFHAGSPPAWGRAVTATGRRHEVTIEDVIAAQGPRVPAAEAAPKRFPVAFVLVLGPQDQVARLEEIDALVQGWVQAFAQASRGLLALEFAGDPSPPPDAGPVGASPMDAAPPDAAIDAEQADVDPQMRAKALALLPDRLG